MDPLYSLIASLDDPFRSALSSMYRGEDQMGSDGERHALDANTRIDPSEGMWLYELRRAEKPKRTLEIGFAYGFSTLFLLAALAKNGFGDHTVIDPFETSKWHGIGLCKLSETRSAAATRFIEDHSVRAAADLARERRSFDVIFIDGNHRFDDVLVDFTVCAPLYRTGGLIVLDDMWMPSVATAVSFIRRNRRDFADVPSPIANTAVFRRQSRDDRAWDHFVPFAIGDA